MDSAACIPSLNVNLMERFSGTAVALLVGELESSTGVEMWDMWRRTKIQKPEDWSMLFSKNTGTKISKEDAVREFDAFWKGYEKHTKLFPDTIKALEALKRQGLLLALVSNNWKETYNVFEKYGITKYFDVTVLSEEVDAIKSDLKPFEYVLSKLGLSPEECIMVGDNLEEDGACRKLGMRFCLMDPQNKHVDEEDGFDYKITILSELEKVINAEMKEV